MRYGGRVTDSGPPPELVLRSYHASSEGAAIPKLWRDEASLRPLGYAFRESSWQRDGIWEGMFGDGLVRGLYRLGLAVLIRSAPNSGTLSATFVRVTDATPDSTDATVSRISSGTREP